MEEEEEEEEERRKLELWRRSENSLYFFCG